MTPHAIGHDWPNCYKEKFGEEDHGVGLVGGESACARVRRIGNDEAGDCHDVEYEEG